MGSGVIWPIESVKPYWAQSFLSTFPIAMASKAFRNIAHRGLGIWDKSVYMGFIALFGWIALLLLAFILLLHIKRRVKC